MKRAFCPVILCGVTVSVLILASGLLMAQAQTAQVKKIEAPVKAVAPDLLRKLTAPTSREVILESIKSLPRPAAPSARPTGAGTPRIKLQIRQGQDKGKPSAATSAAGAAQVAGMSFGYEKIDWKAGVLITPFTVPRYGNGNWPAASITTSYINYMKTQDPGIVVLDWTPVSSNAYSLFTTINVALELPQEAGLYTIALKIARVDGVCDERWFVTRTKCGSYPLSVHLSGQDVPMTKLIDNSGFVGIINFEPRPPQEGSNFGMRQYNATIAVDVAAWGPPQGEPLPEVGPLVFAGIIVTRL